MFHRLNEVLKKEELKLQEAESTVVKTKETDSQIETAKELVSDLRLLISSGYDFLSTKNKRRKHYECCNITFINENSLKYHNQEIHQSNPSTTLFIDIFECSYCNLDFKTISSFEKHLLTQIHVGKRKEMVDQRDETLMVKVDGHFMCRSCEEKYESKRDLRNHARDYHNADMEFHCSICGKKFEKTNRLLGHLRTHERNNEPPERAPCKICNKVLPLANMERHIIVVHTNDEEKEFKCRFCDKKFPLSDQLVRHEAIHKTEKNFLCGTCGKHYMFEKSLRLHEQSVHSGIKLYGCDDCDSRFSFLNDLNVHKRLHTGER